jgi:hypothetical protein
VCFGVLVLASGFPARRASAAAGDAPRPCPTTCRPELLAPRTLHALAIGPGEAPVVDGRLDDAVWERAEPAMGFVESQPHPGAAATLTSEARVAADHDAIYVALRYDDPAADRIVAPLARRDDETTSDWAFVEIDPRHDRRSGFSFGVNPRGVQADGAWMNDTRYDSSWNAVYQAAARIGPHGWTAELRIPFSELPFALPGGSAPLLWGINFYRYSPHHGESANWSPRYTGLAGIISNFNDLVVPAPPSVRRLEVTPYVAPRAFDPSGTRFAAGADARLGLGSNASLAATIRPDFGQVEADPSQVNLTAFELFQAERRPFFLEGLDAFRFDTSAAFATRDVSFANDTAFYSRRVGRVPAGGAAPQTILGAAKLTAETTGGWTTAGFAALTAAQPGVEARTLTAIGRVRRSLGAGSNVGLFAGTVRRLAPPPGVATRVVGDQLAVGGDAVVRFGGARYEWGGWALASRSAGTTEAMARLTAAPAHGFARPDAPASWSRDRTALAGGAGALRLARVAGAFQWDVVARGVSPGFDLNEIGFESTADWIVLAGTWRYDRFRPGRRVRHWAVGSGNTGLAWTWDGAPRTQVVSGYGTIDWRSYWQTKVTLTHESSSLSTGWLRGGPAIRLPARDGATFSLVSDQRRATYWTLETDVVRDAAPVAWSASISPLLNVRSSDRVQWSVGPSYRVDTVAWQPTGVVGQGSDRLWTVARLGQRTLSATTRADVVLSPRLSVQLYAQPFATTSRFDRPQAVVAPRAADPYARVRPLPASAVLDPSEARTLNASVVLRWEYREGSFLTLVWNQVRERTAASHAGLRGAVGRLFDDPATTIVALKVSLRL